MQLHCAAVCLQLQENVADEDSVMTVTSQPMYERRDILQDSRTSQSHCIADCLI